MFLKISQNANAKFLRTPFLRNTSERLFLNKSKNCSEKEDADFLEDQVLQKIEQVEQEHLSDSEVRKKRHLICLMGF